MARQHARLLTAIWSDPDWTSRTTLAQHTFMLLLSQPKLSIVGVMDLLPTRWARLSSDSTPATIGAGIDELEARRYVLVDRNTDELLIRTLVRYDLPSGRLSAPVLKGIWTAWAGVESLRLRDEIVRNLPADVWKNDTVRPHPLAEQMRRSAPLEREQPSPLEREPESPSGSEPPSPSECPSPSPITHHPSPIAAAATGAHAREAADMSSDDPDGAERQRQRNVVDSAIEVLVQRHVTRVPSTINHRSHVEATRSGKRHDYGDTLTKLAGEYPGLSAAELADMVDLSALVELDPASATTPTDGYVPPAKNGKPSKRTACDRCGGGGWLGYDPETGNAEPCECRTP